MWPLLLIFELLTPCAHFLCSQSTPAAKVKSQDHIIICRRYNTAILKYPALFFGKSYNNNKKTVLQTSGQGVFKAVLFYVVALLKNENWVFENWKCRNGPNWTIWVLKLLCVDKALFRLKTVDEKNPTRPNIPYPFVRWPRIKNKLFSTCPKEMTKFLFQEFQKTQDLVQERKKESWI